MISTHFLIMGLSFLICLITAATLFSVLVKNTSLRENMLSAVLAVGGSLIVGTTPLIIAFWYPFDFVADITPKQFLLPLFSSLLILGALFVRRPFMIAIATLLASIISVFGANLFVPVIPQFPIWINQGLSVIILWCFAMGYRSIAGLNPLPQIESITICLGFVVLYLFSLAPFILSAFSAGFLGALLIAYLHSRTQPIGVPGAPFIGFILGWMGLLSFNEYLLPCFITFALFYLLELLVSVGRYITMLPQYRQFEYNSISVESFNSGFAADTLLRVIWNTNVLLLIFGLFQVNSTSVLSIPCFAAIITCWQLYRMLEWQQASKTFKETNREIVEQLKKSVSQFLKPSAKDDDDKTDKN